MVVEMAAPMDALMVAQMAVQLADVGYFEGLHDGCEEG